MKFWAAVYACIITVFVPQLAHASGFGQGVFGADVPFGSATSLSISLGGDVALPLASDGSHFTGNGAHTVTVTSTDVVGYMLYVHPTSGTNMTNGSANITASSNAVAGSLVAGTWGYNTSGSTTNFLGMPTEGKLLKDADGPFKNGDATTVTYGAVTGLSQPAGTYSIAITYTAVAKNP